MLSYNRIRQSEVIHHLHGAVLKDHPVKMRTVCKYDSCVIVSDPDPPVPTYCKGRQQYVQGQQVRIMDEKQLKY